MRRTMLLAALVFAIVAAPAAPSAPYENPRLPVSKRVDDLLSRMNLQEKVGQMEQTERARVFDDASPITDLKLDSILSGGGSTPEENTPEAWADMIDRFQAAALKTRLKIPILYGIDSVHGDGNLLGATVFPHNIGLGATRDPDLVRRVAKITAEETRATGPQWTFSPCICAARDDRWGRTYEAFSEDPRLVEKFETAIDGYQEGGVLATAKHYAGDGDTVYGTGNGDYTIDQGISSRTTGTSGGRRCASTCPPCRSTASTRSCRRTRASTGPRTASATR
jgi:beta-glucosidase